MNLFLENKKDVGNDISIEQFTELYKQIKIAIKRKRANGSNVAKALIDKNAMCEAIEDFLTKERKSLRRPYFDSYHFVERFFDEDIFTDVQNFREESIELGPKIKVWADYENRQQKSGVKVAVIGSKRRVVEMEKHPFQISTICSYFGVGERSLCLEKFEIVDFCENHKEKLSAEFYGTNFFYRSSVDAVPKMLTVAKNKEGFFDIVGSKYIYQLTEPILGMQCMVLPFHLLKRQAGTVVEVDEFVPL